MIRRTSPAGIALIRHFESCKLEAYPDASPKRTPTIGFGHTGAGITLGLRITQERADQLLACDLLSFETAVSSAVRVDLTQGQFDAICSFVFNLGRGTLLNSTLLKRLNAGDYLGAANEFPKWSHAGAEILPGLVARRAAEQKLFESAA